MADDALLGSVDKPPCESSRVRISQGLALLIGMIVVFSCSFLIGSVSGNFLKMTQRTLQLYVGPIFLLFFLSLFVPFSTAWGVIAGAGSALLAGATVSSWSPLNEAIESLGWTPPSEWTGITYFSFQWILLVSLIVGVTVGCLVSLLSPRRKPESQG